MNTRREKHFKEGMGKAVEYMGREEDERTTGKKGHKCRREGACGRGVGGEAQQKKKTCMKMSL